MHWYSIDSQITTGAVPDQGEVVVGYRLDHESWIKDIPFQEGNKILARRPFNGAAQQIETVSRVQIPGSRLMSQRVFFEDP